MNLFMHDRNELYPSKSFMQIIELPGAETLAEDKNVLHSPEWPLLCRSLMAFSQVVNNLARSPDPDRVIDYSESKLTQLLQEALGGNCKTRVICCLRSNPEPKLLAKVLRTCTDLSQVKNFPVLNEYCVESLIIQYRARIQALGQEPDQAGNTKGQPNKVNAPKDQIWRLNNENVFLRDKNERLYHKLGELQETMAQMAGSKADLSSKLVFSEEEKLKISKDLIDLQIETNKMREKYEAENFELKNKILILENRAVELEIQKDRSSRELEMGEDRLQAMEKTRKELADEYVVLKSNYLALSKEHEKEAEEVVASESERNRVEKNLLGNQEEIKEQIENMKKSHEEQQRIMEERIVKMGKELQEAKRAIRNTHHQLSEQSVVRIERVTAGEEE
uniref:Kinesin motor domain-containing protein n=1 Tax=Callorhinchus milii TaxID=7868 RepID=A0A4W3I1I1_CALMI